MEDLFSENLGTAQTQEEFDKIVKNNPTYNIEYLDVLCLSERYKTKEWLKNLWKDYSNFIDTKPFLKETKEKNDKEYKFNNRCWEMYLGCSLFYKGLILALKSEKGPDIKLADYSIWIEAIAPNSGLEKNKVDTISDELSKYPPNTLVGGTHGVREVNEPKILRILTAIDKKNLKYSEYLENGIIQGKDIYVIAVNGGKFDGWQMPDDLVLGALFGKGNMYYKFREIGLEGPYHHFNPQILNANKTPIPANIFCNDSYSNVSAIIYCGDNILNVPKEKSEMGNNFLIVLNPFAKNPLPDHIFQFGSVYKLKSIESGEIIRI